MMTGVADKQDIITTPTDAPYDGLKFDSSICGVRCAIRARVFISHILMTTRGSIVRAGESMEKALQQCCRKVTYNCLYD